MNDYIITIVAYYASLYNIDPVLALSVIKVESNFNQNAKGLKGEIGLFQIMPNNIKFTLRDAVYDPALNIREGIKLLAWNKKYCKHKVNNEYLVCYNYGIRKAASVKFPKKTEYYKKVMKEMNNFIKDQKVMILLLHELKVDGEAIYLDESLDPHHKNKHRVLNEFGQVMFIAKDRIIDYNDYWKQKKENK